MYCVVGGGCDVGEGCVQAHANRYLYAHSISLSLYLYLFLGLSLVPPLRRGDAISAPLPPLASFRARYPFAATDGQHRFTHLMSERSSIHGFKLRPRVVNGLIYHNTTLSTEKHLIRSLTPLSLSFVRTHPDINTHKHTHKHT